MSKTRASGRTVGGLRSLSLQAPAVTLLLLWMLVPLGMTVWFSLLRYNLLMPGMEGFAGLENYEFLFTDPALWRAMGNTLLLVGSVLVITVVGGVLLAVLFQQEFPGRGIARVLAISPFFVMPTVSALVWKNMMMHPSNGVLAWLAGVFGLPAVDWFSALPLTSIIIIVAWQWLPFALLILLTAMQSLDEDQVEAARMDGAGPLSIFFYITLPHLKRAIS
ncbi:MAG: sugar ABC transporter permease, partial [Halomonas sp.]|nr:sugar ABC transporter permease [Halomonas sp.]MDX5503314.1 sugar ABC transporter permease [Halomonas sp.]